MPKKIFIGLVIAAALIAAIAAVLFYDNKFYIKNIQQGAEAKDSITWGINFSQSQAEYLKLDWKELYLAIINDLKAKNIKLITNWNWVEGQQDDFYFADTDWQVKQAERNNVKLVYVLGMKTGRWPECHIPGWANNLPKQDQQRELLKYITQVVLRYRNSKAIQYWQVENEPFFQFGDCPFWYYQTDNFIRTEVGLIKSLDPSRKIIISDSGERSSWTNAAAIGDIVGITMYRNAWTSLTKTFGFESYSFLDPSVYKEKADNITRNFKKEVICIELQAEPWASRPFMEAPIDEQLKSMNLDMFKENIEFARMTGLKTFYFWGAEWWYWIKTQHGHPEIWNQAKQLF